MNKLVIGKKMWPRSRCGHIFRHVSPNVFGLSVNLAAVRDPRDGDEFRGVVDHVQQAPITGPKSPLVLLAPQFFAPYGARIAGQRQNFPIQAAERRIVECIQFLLRRLLDFERVANHAGRGVSGGLHGIARKEWPFPSGAIQTLARPKSPPRWPRVFSGR